MSVKPRQPLFLVDAILVAWTHSSPHQSSQMHAGFSIDTHENPSLGSHEYSSSLEDGY